MFKKSLIKKISENLTEIYEKYNSEGILSLYLWGSILTPDFDPLISDVDSIAIVEDNFLLENESKIQIELSNKNPEIKKFGFRIIYKSEFNNGVIKSNLGKVAIPELLLLDFPTWKFICGTNFKQEDFNLAVPNYTEAIKIRYDSTLERWPDIEKIKPEEVQYFIKQILRIIHLQQLKRDGKKYSLFSYSSLKTNTFNVFEINIINICLNIKKYNWDFEIFKKHRDELEIYINENVEPKKQ